MDIVRLNKAGNRATHIFSKNLRDYEIFGDTVYSPCSGIIMYAMDNNPDNIPPARVQGRGKLNGILIENDSFYVFLGHLEHGSLLVQQGEHIVAGQPLALAGNSGFTIEPHLHIQAHVNTHSGTKWYREKPLYILFNDKGYLLFQTIPSGTSQ